MPMRIVGCFLECDGKFVILLRHSHKPDGDTWGLPGGKVADGETDEAAIIRELAEETGYAAQPAEVERIGQYDFISSRNEPYEYITYRVRARQLPVIRLETAAHAAYQWITPKACYAKSDLIADFHTLLKLVGYIA